MKHWEYMYIELSNHELEVGLLKDDDFINIIAFFYCPKIGRAVIKSQWVSFDIL
jgi:hypothetical protein